MPMDRRWLRGNPIWSFPTSIVRLLGSLSGIVVAVCLQSRVSVSGSYSRRGRQVCQDLSRWLGIGFEVSEAMLYRSS